LRDITPARLYLIYYANVAVLKYICLGAAALSTPKLTVATTPPGLAVIADLTADTNGLALPDVNVGLTAAEMLVDTAKVKVL